MSFEDPPDQRTWVFDLTFLTSHWTCIYGRGCPGVLTARAPELEQGCCSYGAHFTDDDDRARVEAKAAELTDDEWQFRGEAQRRGGVTKAGGEGTKMTRLVKDACIFLNRPGFANGAGCALHQAAVARGERPMDWKPDVCWQLPLRLEEEEDEDGRLTATLREWRRRDWGDGGDEFGWWCTESDEAHDGPVPVYEGLRDEIIGLVGATAYGWLVEHLREEAAANGRESGNGSSVEISRTPPSRPTGDECMPSPPRS